MKRFLCVLMTMMLLCSGVGVRVAKATTWSMHPSLGSWYIWNNYGSQYQMVFTDGSPMSGSPEFSSPSGTVSKNTVTWHTWSIVFNGVDYSTFGSVYFQGGPGAQTEWTEVVFSMAVYNFSGWNDNNVDTWSVTLDFDYTGSGNTQEVDFSCSGSGVVKAGAGYTPLVVTVSGDATPYVDESVQFTHTVTGGIDSHYGYWEVYNSVGGLEYAGSQVANGTALTYSFGHAGYHDVTYTAIDSDNSTAHGHFMTTAYEDALDCSLSGPSQAAVNVPVNFTATGSGGVVHTGDSYDYRLGTRFGADAVSYGAWGTSGTLSKTFGSNGTYTVVAQVRDSHGATHDSNEITVYVGDTVEAGAYRWSACRRGVYGENIDFTLFQYVNGAESQLMGSAWTLGSGEMAWYNATGQVVHSAVDAGSITMTPGGGGRTWYSGEKAMSFSFVITHGAVSIPVIGSFGGISGCAGGWNQTDGTVINPETFPAEEATGWGWLDPLRIMFEKLFNLLFVPTEAQMRTLMPSGTLGASLLEGTSWGSAGSTWQLHVHWGAHEIVLVNLTFADYASNGFVVAIRTAVQIAYLLAMVYMVVVLL
jgi:hypothetical protein